MPQINLTINFFLDILHFKDPCYFIGQQHFEPSPTNQNFARYGIGSKLSIIMFVFFRFFPGIANKIFFQRIQKPYYGGYLATFHPNLKYFCQFLNVLVI